MKKFALGFFSASLLFAVLLSGFATGYNFGRRSVLSFRSVAPDRKELKCTCVPCLPDLFCQKCGHKSRDCPKLRDYFAKRGGAGGVSSSNAVQSVEGIAPGGPRL